MSLKKLPVSSNLRLKPTSQAPKPKDAIGHALDELPPELPDYRDPTGEYVPILIEGLRAGVAAEFDLYMRAGLDYFVVKPRSMSVNLILIHRAVGSRTPYLYLRRADADRYFSRLDENVAAVVRDPELPVRAKAAVLTDHAVGIVESLFNDPVNPRSLGSAKNFSQECVSFVGQHKHAFLHLVELASHDQYTFAHSVGVAAFSVALARELLPHASPKDLADVGLAGLLHDIGKCMVDPAIINKRGPLNPDEWAIMKKHPEYGAEILRRHKGLNPIIALVAEGHHETLVGTGYPRGKVASQLEPLVKITALTDAFSALTTRRSYSQPRSSLDAFLLLRENLNKKFEPDTYRRFVMLFLDPKKSANFPPEKNPLRDAA